MKKFYQHALVALAVVCPTAMQAYQSTWNGNVSDDEYAGITWNKHWNKDTKQLEAASGYIAADWMADLPDNMFVAHVSIPGAHDFATGEDNWVTSLADGPASSTTQAVSMREQMDRGIRAVDFRPGLNDGKLYCNHGLARTKKTLEEAFDDIITFLNKHPKEFFVVHFFRGNVYKSGSAPSGGSLLGATDSASDQERYNNLLKALFETKYAGKVVAFHPNLTVEEARGKMVLFLRDRIDFVHIEGQARIENWDIYFEDDSNPAEISLEGNKFVATRLHVQDISEGDDDVRNTKLVHSQNLINYSQTQPTPNNELTENGFYSAQWVMNFTSIDNSGTSKTSDNTNGYKGGASVMNPETMRYINDNLGRGPLGVFFSDYVLRTQTKAHNKSKYYTVYGDELVYAIIANNFTGGENAPVVRYAIDTTKDWTESQNPFNGEYYFLRNIGASLESDRYQYFGGGANYGAHAIVNYAGHKVQLVSDDGQNYKISTSYGNMQNKGGAYYLDNDWDSNGTDMEIVEGTYEGRRVYYIKESGTDLALTAVNYLTSNTPNTYFDRPEFFVDPKAFDESDTYQMWEFVTYDYRVNNLLTAKGNQDRGMDATFLIPAYSFGNGDSGNGEWKTTAGNNISQIGQVWHENGAMWRVANDGSGTARTKVWTLKVNVPNLPNGDYSLYFQCAVLNHNDVKFYVNGVQKNFPGYNCNVATGGDKVAEVGAFFNESEENGAVRLDFSITNGSLELRFEDPGHGSSSTATYLDNFRLTYKGQDGGNKKTIKLGFPNQWNTCILPFDQPVPSKLKAYRVVGYEDSEYAHNDGETYPVHIVLYDETISDESNEKITVFEANKPYLVYNSYAMSPSERAEAEAKDSSLQAPRHRVDFNDASEVEPNVYQFTGYATNLKNLYTDDSGSLTGTINGSTVDLGHYHLVQNDEIQFFSLNEDNDEMTVPANRAFFNYKLNDGLQYTGIYFEPKHVVTGVENVVEDKEIRADALVDVYGIGGVMVRRQVAKREALTDLPRGIYILCAGGTTLKVAK